MYLFFFYGTRVSIPVAEGMLAEEGEEEAGSEENETRKKRWLDFVWSLFFYEVSVPAPVAEESQAEESQAEEGEEEARSEESEVRERSLEMLEWRMERLERERKLAMQIWILERLELKLDKTNRKLQRIQWNQWKQSTERMYKKTKEENAALREPQRRLEGPQRNRRGWMWDLGARVLGM